MDSTAAFGVSKRGNMVCLCSSAMGGPVAPGGASVPSKMYTGCFLCMSCEFPSCEEIATILKESGGW